MNMFNMLSDIILFSNMSYGDPPIDEQVRVKRDFENIGEVMSNLYHTIDPDLEAKLKSGKFRAEYSAYNFWGLIWYEEGKFHCHIKQYRSHVETISAETLEEIMAQACDKYGND